VIWKTIRKNEKEFLFNNNKKKNIVALGKRPGRPVSSQPRAAPWVLYVHEVRPARAKA